jgi:hypothetical protein
MIEDKPNQIPRRTFLAGLGAGLAASAAGLQVAVARQGDLYILKGGDLERLRLDFNGNRQRVRLLAIVSPT